MSVLKSTVLAVRPPTATVTPGTLPSVAGMTVSRKVARALTDAASSPVPASGTPMIAAVCAGLTTNVIGSFIWPVASAARTNAWPAASMAGDVTSGASTTTWAGPGPPGNTCWMRLYVCRAAVFCGRSLTPGSAVCRRSTGTASATRTQAETVAVSAGRARVRSRIAPQTRLCPAGRRIRLMKGSCPRSTRSPSRASRAGSRVSDPMTAAATTSIAACAIP